MRKQDDDEFIPPNDTLAVILRKAEEGQFIDHAGAEVQRCQAKLLAVAAKRGARAVGTVTITLKIEMGKDGHADVTGDIKTKEPKMPRASTGIYHAHDDIIALLAEVERLRFAALMAYGVRGGPGAWRWASDPMGTTLDTETAWERMLSEMRAARGGGEAPPCYRCGTVDEPRAEVTLCGDCMPEPRAHEAPPAPPDDLCPRCREFNCTPECIASDGTFDDGPRPMKFS